MLGGMGVVIGLEVFNFFFPSDFRFLNNPRDTCRVQYVDYMDEIASEIGVKPNLQK